MIGTALRLAVGAVWLAVGAYAALSQWAGANGETDPRGVLSLAPDNLQALLVAAEMQRREEKGTSSDSFGQLNAHILRRGPLLDAPLVYAGLAADAAGDTERARTAFEAALIRSPRNRLVRTWLARQAIEEGDYAEAVRQIDRLMIIDDGKEVLHIEMLTDIAGYPEGLAAVEAALVTKPAWASAFARELGRTFTDFEASVRIIALAPGEQEQFLRRAIEERGVEAAYRAWLQFVPQGERHGLGWPYDPQFARLKAPPPFNWTYLSDQVDEAGRDGLEAVYLGRGIPVLLEQIVLLSPGAHRFEAVVEGDTQEDGGAFAWTIQCMGEAAELGRVETKPLTAAASMFAFDFEVPETNCVAQIVRLQGQPGELMLRAHSLTRSVDIGPAGPIE